MKLLGFSHSTGVTVAEVAFLLLLIAGIWIAVAWTFPTSKWQRTRMIVAGILIAGAGALLITAAYKGNLFS